MLEGKKRAGSSPAVVDFADRLEANLVMDGHLFENLDQDVAMAVFGRVVRVTAVAAHDQFIAAQGF